MEKDEALREIERQAKALRDDQRIPRTVELADDPFRALGFEGAPDPALVVHLKERPTAFHVGERHVKSLIGELVLEIVRTGPGETIRVIDT